MSDPVNISRHFAETAESLGGRRSEPVHILATAGYQDIRIRFFEPSRRWHGFVRQDVVIERWQDAGIGAYIVPLASFTIRPVPELAGHDFRAPIA